MILVLPREREANPVGRMSAEQNAPAAHVRNERLTCLVVDDEAAVRTALRRMMEAQGYDCHLAASGPEALALLESEAVRTAPVPLVLTDYHMPDMDGATLMRGILARWPQTAVIIVTGDADLETAVRCLGEGALDYLTKPLRIDEVRARVAQAMSRRQLIVENYAYRTALEERVVQQAHRYEELFLASLQSLADALEVKDAYTWGHSTRVARYAVAVARELGVTGSLLDQIELGARLHDIGKIGVRETVLNKDGVLTDEEYAHVMEHPVIGWRLLAPLLRDVPHALAIVRSHHERFDGRGTPDGLTALEIPLGARIIAVVDSYDAMTSGRVYRPGRTAEDAIAEMRRCAGTQFDPGCVAAFERALASGAVPRPDHVPRPSRPMLVVA